MTARFLTIAGLSTGLSTFAMSAWAQTAEPETYGHHPHMWGGYGGWGHGAWGGGWLHGPVMVIVTILVLALVAMLVARLMGCGRHRCGHGRNASNALSILEERYAKGEIDKAEFEERRTTLRS